MIIDLIAALSSGFALMGLVLIGARLLRRTAARWVLPAAMGAGMIGYSVWAEYSWAGRMVPPGADGAYAVVQEDRARIWYRPWTWAVPPVGRMLVLDRRFTRINPAQPDLVMTRLVRLARYVPESGFLAVFDCATARMTPLADGVELGADGALEGAIWSALPEGDPVLTGACALREELTHDRGQGT